jgi:rSAM/selenodomain-associated transferase 2
VTPLVSVIVPVLDEASTVSSLLDHLASLPGRFETLIADGGSADRTVELSEEHALDHRLVAAPRGRAGQMNAGAQGAAGELLLFLHADTRLPSDFYSALVSACADPLVIGGNFTLRYDGGDRFAAVLATWRGLERRLGIYYGDSAIFLRRDAFGALNGYRPLAIMEDYDLARRMERAGRTVCLPGPVVTSSRRWRSLGLRRTIAAWVVIRGLFLLGVPPERLARLYRPVR